MCVCGGRVGGCTHVLGVDVIEHRSVLTKDAKGLEEIDCALKI